MKDPSNPVHLPLHESPPRASIKHMNINHWHDFGTLSRHTSNCVLLRGASVFPGTPGIASSSTACYWVAVFSHYSVKLRTIFIPLYTSVYLPQLHFIQHGTYGQPGEESLFTDESRSLPWKSTCKCIAEDSQSSLQIKCFKFPPNLRV